MLEDTPPFILRKPKDFFDYSQLTTWDFLKLKKY